MTRMDRMTRLARMARRMAALPPVEADRLARAGLAMEPFVGTPSSGEDVGSWASDATLDAMERMLDAAETAR